jgi:hypothetical protein
MTDAFQTSGTSPTSEAAVDFRCENHGSIFLLYPLSKSARSWVEQNLPSDAQFFGNAVVIEHRYVWPILEGIQNESLTVRS